MAADVLEWDQPLIAEEPLVAALTDSSQEVAVAAAETLRWYQTRRALAAFAPLRTWKRVALREAALEAFDALREGFLAALRDVPALRPWMEPVWSLLAPSPEELRPLASIGDGAPSHPAPVRERLAADVVRAIYDEADGAWCEKKDRFRRIDWESFDPGERDALTAYLTAHADPWVREAGCGPLALWGMRDALLGLVDDPHALVAKTATYWLGQLATRPDPRVAARAWRRLDESGVASTRAQEALSTYVAHATRDEAVPWLVARVRDDEREGVRLASVGALAELGAAGEVRALLW